MLLLRTKTDEGSRTLLREIDGDLSSDETLASVVAKLRNHEVAKEAEAEANRWAQKAIARMAPLPDGSTKRALISFAEAVVDRNA